MKVNNIHYIYAYLDPRKQGKFVYGEYEFEYEPFYIGKGKNERMYNHLKETINNTANPYKINKIKKIRLETKSEPIIVKLLDNLSNEIANKKEIELIKLIGRVGINNGVLTNLTDGGEGGLTSSVENMSKIFKKMWNNEEKRKEILEKRKITFTQEEFKIKKSLSVLGEKNPNKKFTEKEVINFLTLMSEGWTLKHLSEKFKIRKDYFYELKIGDSYRNLKKEYGFLYEKMKRYKSKQFKLNPDEIYNIWLEFLKTNQVNSKLENLIIKNYNKSKYLKVLYKNNEKINQFFIINNINLNLN